MKKLLIALTVIMSLMMSSCGRHSAINIDIPELSSGKIYIVYADPDQISSRQQENIAEADIKEGKVELSLDSVTFTKKIKDCTITIVNEERRFACNLPLPIEKGKTIAMTITGIKEYLESKDALRVSYSGSKHAEMFSEFWKSINDSFLEIAKGGDLKSISEKQVSACKDFLKKYPESAYPYTVIIGQISNMSDVDNPLMKYCEELSTQKSDNKWHNFLVTAYKDRMTKEAFAKKMVFAAKDKDGKDFSERDFKGKVTLLHFWAVQSPKCLEVFANIKNIYDKYHSKGLEVVSICIDPKINAWIDWNKTNNISWYNLLGDGTILTQRYSFNDIPFYMLFDKEGQIVSKSNIVESLESGIIQSLEK